MGGWTDNVPPTGTAPLGCCSFGVRRDTVSHPPLLHEGFPINTERGIRGNKLRRRRLPKNSGKNSIKTRKTEVLNVEKPWDESRKLWNEERWSPAQSGGAGKAQGWKG